MPDGSTPGPIEDALAAHALLARERVPASARAAVKARLLDTIACMIAGLRSPECGRLIDRQLARAGPQEATIVGCETRVPAGAAALCNAGLGHWMEWDDLDDIAVSHTSAAMWPAILAAAEAGGRDDAASGEELLAAAAAAYDIASAVGGPLGGYAHIGWWATAPGSMVGAAAAAARLMGLPAAGIASAMGLAATAAGLTRQPLIDKLNGKNALGVQATQAVMTALELAGVGVMGARRYLTGDYGYNALLAGGRADPARGVAALGERFAVEAMSVKPFPCCRATHQAIDLALKLRDELPDAARRIERIVFAAPQPTFETCGAPFELGDNPRVSALFSIPYTVTLALHRGPPGLDDFDAERIRADRVLAEFARRVRVDAFALKPGEGMYDPPLAMKVTLVDGSTLERSTAVVKGSPAYPMTAAEMQAKLSGCAGSRLREADLAQLVAAVDAIERDGLRPVMTLLRSGVARTA